MKIELIFERTVCDPTVTWTEIKKVAVDVPYGLVASEHPYHLTGMVVTDEDVRDGGNEEAEG